MESESKSSNSNTPTPPDELDAIVNAAADEICDRGTSPMSNSEEGTSGDVDVDGDVASPDGEQALEVKEPENLQEIPENGTVKDDPMTSEEDPDEPYQVPVNGIVQPPFTPRPGRPGRVTNQLEFIKKVVLPPIWCHNHAWPFRTPVNAIKMGLEDFHTKIRRPMDLGTIKKRLENRYYTTGKECIDDFILLFTNCYVYNDPALDVTQMGRTLEKIFLDKLSGVPKEEVEVVKGKRGRKKKGVVVTRSSEGQSQSQGSSGTGSDVGRKERVETQVSESSSGNPEVEVEEEPSIGSRLRARTMRVSTEPEGKGLNSPSRPGRGKKVISPPVVVDIEDDDDDDIEEVEVVQPKGRGGGHMKKFDQLAKKINAIASQLGTLAQQASFSDGSNPKKRKRVEPNVKVIPSLSPSQPKKLGKPSPARSRTQSMSSTTSSQGSRSTMTPMSTSSSTLPWAGLPEGRKVIPPSSRSRSSSASVASSSAGSESSPPGPAKIRRVNYPTFRGSRGSDSSSGSDGSNTSGGGTMITAEAAIIAASAVDNIPKMREPGDEMISDFESQSASEDEGEGVDVGNGAEVMERAPEVLAGMAAVAAENKRVIAGARLLEKMSSLPESCLPELLTYIESIEPDVDKRDMAEAVEIDFAGMKHSTILQVEGWVDAWNRRNEDNVDVNKKNKKPEGEDEGRL